MEVEAPEEVCWTEIKSSNERDERLIVTELCMNTTQGGREARKEFTVERGSSSPSQPFEPHFHCCLDEHHFPSPLPAS